MAPTSPPAFDAVRLADDDDGDLSNGTPHECAFVEGFTRHGLGPLSASQLRVEGGLGVPEEGWIDASEGLAIDLAVPNPVPDCVRIEAQSATLNWRVAGGDYQQETLQIEDGRVVGSVGSALEPGTFVELFVEIETSRGQVFAEPRGGPIKPATVYVGNVLEVRCEDFEEDDGGFSSELLSGEPGEGADDWIWAEPQGFYGDPSEAASGTKVWGNDLGGGNYNGAYQDGKHNRLESPVWRTKPYRNVFLRYARWLQVEDGTFDQARITADSVDVWSNWATSEDQGTDHHLDDRWATHVVPLPEAALDDGKVTLGWELQSDQGLFFGGWNIDDVCLFAPDTPDNRLGIGDFQADDGSDGVTLTWTHPRHDPVERVRVVRTRGRWPLGPDDGDIVWEADDVALGADAEVVDSTSGKRLYYAVYAYNGTEWLSYTLDGWNADTIDPNPVPLTGDEELTAAASCACRQGTPGGALGLLLIGVGLVLRRRRS